MGVAAHVGEAAADHNLAQAVHEGLGQGIDRVVRAGAGSELAVQRAVRIQPRNVIQVHAVEIGEEAAHQDAPVRLDGNRPDGIVGPIGGRGSEKAASTEPSELRRAMRWRGTPLAMVKSPPTTNWLFGLERHGIHGVVQAQGIVSDVARTGRFVDRFGVNDVQRRRCWDCPRHRMATALVNMHGQRLSNRC